MIQELVYTSAPKGLKLGSSGFCTVASSPGMAQNMASFLESLSGYRHLEEPGSRMNPVNFSFLKHRIGGQDYYILSKISDAGLDYSQRSNKIAHHICLTHSDRLGQSPVSILASDVMVSQWLQAPANLPPRNMPRFPAPAIARCSTWEQQFGDAGWAGAMIEKAIQGQNVFVIFRPGTPTLQLLKEAFAILPAEQQWDLSFSTFFTRLPPRVECRIRFVVEGSDEALAAKRNRNALVLSHAMPDQAPASKYADAARSGQPIASKSNAGLAPSIPQPTSLGGQEPPFDDDDDDEIPIVDEEYRPEPIPIRRKKQSGAPDLPSGKKSTSAAPSPNTPTPRNSLPEMPIAQGGSRSALWLTLVICIALMILTNVGTFLVAMYWYSVNTIAENSKPVDEVQSKKSMDSKSEESIEKLESEISSKLRPLIENEIKSKLRNPLKAEVRKELEPKIRKELEAKVLAEKELEIRKIEGKINKLSGSIEDVSGKLEKSTKINKPAETQRFPLMPKGYSIIAKIDQLTDLDILLPTKKNANSPQIDKTEEGDGIWKFEFEASRFGKLPIRIIYKNNFLAINTEEAEPESNFVETQNVAVIAKPKQGASIQLENWETVHHPTMRIELERTQKEFSLAAINKKWAAHKMEAFFVRWDESARRWAKESSEFLSRNLGLNDTKLNVVRHTDIDLELKALNDSVRQIKKEKEKLEKEKDPKKKNPDRQQQLDELIRNKKEEIKKINQFLTDHDAAGIIKVGIFLKYPDGQLITPKPIYVIDVVPGSKK